MKQLNNYQELQCWSLALELCEIVYDLCEKAWLPADDELACRWYVASLHISGKIAFAFGPEKPERAVEYLPLVKKYCMETVFWSWVAQKKALISKKNYNHILIQAKRIVKKIDAILRYLEKYWSQEKYQWKVLFNDQE